jgi:hypothetical protein
MLAGFIEKKVEGFNKALSGLKVLEFIGENGWVHGSGKTQESRGSHGRRSNGRGRRGGTKRRGCAGTDSGGLVGKTKGNSRVCKVVGWREKKNMVKERQRHLGDWKNNDVGSWEVLVRRQWL